MHSISVLQGVHSIVEILTPRVSFDAVKKMHFDAFCEKYRRALHRGCAVSIPDNPMGHMRVPALSAIGECRCAFDAEKHLVNLNTYHTKNELDAFFHTALNTGLRYLLVVRGDGSTKLPKLTPEDLEIDCAMVTSIELLEYIHREHPKRFVTGVAFNQYKPISFEMKKLRKKIEKGAQYIVTQPVIGRDPAVLELKSFGVPLIVEAWMSKDIELLMKSIKAETRIKTGEYDPVKNLRILRDAFSEEKVYLSFLSSKSDWSEIFS